MASPTSENSQITDAVTQSNTATMGQAPAMAMGSLYQTVGNAMGNAAHNATTAAQQSNVTAQAATTMGVATLLGLETFTTDDKV